MSPARRLSGAAALAAAAAVATITPAGRAECVQGGTALDGCRLDLVTGPVLSSSRVVGLAGAYQGIAEGIEGYSVNAAAPAVREAYSRKWFEWDVDASISFPSAFRDSDFENSGRTGFKYRDFIFLTGGVNFRLGPWGMGFTADLQRYNVTPQDAVKDVRYDAIVGRFHILLARHFFDENLVIGAGLRVVGFGVQKSGGSVTSTDLVSLTHSSCAVIPAQCAPELGFLVRPEGYPFRFGATWRFPVKSDDPVGPANPESPLARPKGANLPWELDLGLALQFGPRPLNVKWLDPHVDLAQLQAEVHEARGRRQLARKEARAAPPSAERDKKLKELEETDARERAIEDRDLADVDNDVMLARKARYAALPREYLLVTLGLLVTGPTEDGVSLESYFEGTVRRAGMFTTWSPRAGLEAEVVPNYVKARIGTYVEPSRFGFREDARAFRQHFTAGFDVYLFRWSVFGLLDADTSWRFTGVMDLTPRYSNWGVSVGNWH